MEKKWLKKAVDQAHKGEFTAKAKKAGMTTSEYAKSVLKEDSKASEHLKKKARFAQTATKIAKG